MSQTAAERQRAYRARHGIAKTITIHLTEEEAELLERCFSRQGTDHNLALFKKNALLTGAKFRANSGTPTQQKIR